MADLRSTAAEATASSAAEATSAAEAATTAEASAFTHSARHSHTAGVAHVLPSLTVSEDIEAIDEVCHEVAVDGVVA